MTILDNNLIETVKILDENEIFYWIGQGSLLGIERENNLIEWDYDIDFCVWNEQIDKNRIIKLMEKKGFKYWRHVEFDEEMPHLSFEKNGGRRVDINFYCLGKNSNGEEIAYTKWGIPNGPFLKFIDAVAHVESYNSKYKFFVKCFTAFRPIAKLVRNFLIRKKIFYKHVGYQQPYKFLKKFKIINFHNLKINVPVHSKQYLEYLYGKEWTIPKKHFSWWKVKNLKKEYKHE